MSKRYPGNFVTGNPVALSQTSNNGIWDTKDNYHAVNSGTWQEPDGIYEIGRSLRFSSNGCYLTRTPTTTGNRRIWTYSTWVKRGTLGSVVAGTETYQVFMEAAGSSSPSTRTAFMFNNADQLDIFTDNTSTSRLISTQTFKDYSAWYHFVFAFDTTQAASVNRIKVWCNGKAVTTFGTANYPSQHLDTSVNTAYEHRIGKPYDSFYFNGYVAETQLIDGKALDPSYFGYFDSVTNIWQPKKYTGTYGPCGFYLPFTEYSWNTQGLARNFAGGTNWIKKSQDFADSTATGWQKVRSNVTANATTAPDGTNTATKFYEDTTANNTHDLNLASPASGITFGTPYCFSFYAKSTGESRDLISYNLVNNGYTSVAQWSGHVVTGATDQAAYGTPISKGSQYVGNGWWRFWGSAYLNQDASSTFNVTLSLNNASASSVYTGNGSSGIYIWGAMLNQGTTPDSYVPTTGSVLNNNFSPNNFSLTAGATYDSSVDSPTNVFTTATDIGGVVPGNYAVLNQHSAGAYMKDASAGLITADAGMRAQVPSGSGGYGTYSSTFAVPATGYWYAEFKARSGSYVSANNNAVGIFGTTNTTSFNGSGPWASTVGYNYFDGNVTNGDFRNNSSISQGVAGFTVGDTLMIALGNGKLWFGKNGTWLGTGSPNPSTATSPAYSGLTGDFYFYCMNYTAPHGYAFDANFGQRPYAYTPPTGFKSLNTTHLQAQGLLGVAGLQPFKYQETQTYAGTLSKQKITNAGFQPDLVISKNTARSDEGWAVFDSQRGPNNRLLLDVQVAEANAGDSLTSFNSDGYTLGTWSGTNHIGQNVSYQWKQSPSSGLNILTYTGNGSNSRALSHNLGVIPKAIWVRDRTTGAGYNWNSWWDGMSANEYINLNASTGGTQSYNTIWGSTPTSSNIYIGTSGTAVNTNGDNHIAYVWSEVPGYSKIGRYAGNGSSDGTFVYCGFRPKWVLVKGISSGNTDAFYVRDSARDIENPLQSLVSGGWSSTGDAINSSTYGCDFYANGFKARGSHGFHNTDGGVYVYMAFAENPFALNNRAK